ncbi:hypothetical protein Tco_0046900 [Tanacetum coccineum]
MLGGFLLLKIEFTIGPYSVSRIISKALSSIVFALVIDGHRSYGLGLSSNLSQAAWNAEREVLIREAQDSKTLAQKARNEATSCKDFITQFLAHFNQQAGSSSNFTPFNFRPSSSTPSSSTPSSSTHPHNALAEFNSDPNLYQDIINPNGCYKPVRDDEDGDEDEDDNDDE